MQRLASLFIPWGVDRLRPLAAQSLPFWGTVSYPPALGASGAVNAVVSYWILMNPTRVVYLNFFIPVPAFLLGFLYLAADIAGEVPSETQPINWAGRDDSCRRPTSGVSRSETNIGHAAHLAGMATGLAFFLLHRYGRRRGW